MFNPYPIQRNSDGWVIENCPVNIGVKIGSFDCTANCPNNGNTMKEIQELAFELKVVRCSKITTKNQLTIDI